MTENHEPADHPRNVTTVEEYGPYVVQGHVPAAAQSTDRVRAWGAPDVAERRDAAGAVEPIACAAVVNLATSLCDDTHLRCGFDGTETAEINTTAECCVIYRGRHGIVVRRDDVLGWSGFVESAPPTCRRWSSIWTKTEAARASDRDDRALSLLGNLTYHRGGGRRGGAGFRAQVAVTVEITVMVLLRDLLLVTVHLSAHQGECRRYAIALTRAIWLGSSKIKPLCHGLLLDTDGARKNSSQKHTGNHVCAEIVGGGIIAV